MRQRSLQLYSAAAGGAFFTVLYYTILYYSLLFFTLLFFMAFFREKLWNNYFRKVFFLEILSFFDKLIE